MDRPVLIQPADLPAGVPRREFEGVKQIYIRKDVELKKFGFTPNCSGCSAVQTGKAPQSHSEACRARIQKAMEDDDSMRVRLVERALKVQDKAEFEKVLEAHEPETKKAKQEPSTTTTTTTTTLEQTSTPSSSSTALTSVPTGTGSKRSADDSKVAILAQAKVSRVAFPTGEKRDLPQGQSEIQTKQQRLALPQGTKRAASKELISKELIRDAMDEGDMICCRLHRKSRRCDWGIMRIGQSA